MLATFIVVAELESACTIAADWSYCAAVVLLVALVTPVKVVPVLPVYVKNSDPIFIVPLDVKSAVEATVIVPVPDKVSPLPITSETAAVSA